MPMKGSKRTIIGLIEKIIIIGREREKQVLGKIDTGASRSSIDSRLAAELNLGPVVATKLVKSAHGNSVRPIVKTNILIAGQKISTKFTLADRAHMKYNVLIGNDVLKEGNFLIDPVK